MQNVAAVVIKITGCIDAVLQMSQAECPRSRRKTTKELQGPDDVDSGSSTLISHASSRDATLQRKQKQGRKSDVVRSMSFRYKVI